MNARCINCQDCSDCSDCENLTNCSGLHSARNQANIHMTCRIITGCFRVQYAGRVRVYQGRFMVHSQTTVTIDTDQPWVVVEEAMA